MFERFTQRARQVMVLAQREATEMHHGFIGTEHLLLGLVAEGEGIGAKALEASGITTEKVRATVKGLIGDLPTTDVKSGSPPFTPRSKKVLELSLREALQMGHNYIGTEHILLAVIREGEGVGAKALVELGASLADVRQKVIELLAGHTPTRPPLSPAADAALKKAGDRGPIDTGTLLDAIVADVSSRASKALASVGLSLEQIAAAIGATPVEGTSDDPQAARVEITIGEWSQVINDSEIAGMLSSLTVDELRDALRKRLRDNPGA